MVNTKTPRVMARSFQHDPSQANADNGYIMSFGLNCQVEMTIVVEPILSVFPHPRVVFMATVMRRFDAACTPRNQG